MTTPTPEECDKLCLFRHNVKNLISNPEDHFLLRWLRAKDLDVEKAEEMLRNYLTWRKTNPEFKLIHNYIPDPAVYEYYSYKYIGFDPVGRPVVWVPFGRWEVRRMLESKHKEHCFTLQYKILEEMVENVERARLKSGADQIIVIGDSAELNFRKVAHYETIQAILRFFKEFEAYYPEYLHSAYIVNIPSVFSYIFNLVKPFVTARTLSKVKMFDFDESKWKPVLLAELPKSVVPLEYGGSGEKVL